MKTEWEWITRIIVTAILSGFIGWERERHARAAGFRTIILVGVGCCLSMIVSLRIYELSLDIDSPYLRIDPARIAYGVLTGIGFIGAGTIIRDRGRVMGITTAACLWVISAIGLATGCGFYILGISTTILVMLTLLILKKFEYAIPHDTYNHLNIKFTVNRTIISEKILPLISRHRYTVMELTTSENKKEKFSTVSIILRSRGKKNNFSLLNDLDLFEEIYEVEFK